MTAEPAKNSATDLTQLRRLRWLVRAVLVLGVAASVTANVLHAQPNFVSQVIAAWPPLALLVNIDLISRVPVHRKGLAAVRVGATTTIAAIAAWVSYWHMAGVAARYGEQGAAPFLLPLSVDGLVVIASVCLVELAGRIRAAEAVPVPAAVVTAIPVPRSAASDVHASAPPPPPPGPPPARKRPAVSSGGRRGGTKDTVRGQYAAGVGLAEILLAWPRDTQKPSKRTLELWTTDLREQHKANRGSSPSVVSGAAVMSPVMSGVSGGSDRPVNGSGSAQGTLSG